jgi:hypothetical protein
MELCKLFNYEYKNKGDKICSVGDRDNKFYIILRGKVALEIPKVLAKDLHKANSRQTNTQQT